MKVKKAVFPVAGLGTRFLPATKASPKEMLPIVDKPLIQFAVEEAVKAGITELIFVTSGSKRAIEDHFDSNYELEAKLAEKGAIERLKQVQTILPAGVSCVYIRQKEALGLGHAVLCAKDVVNNEPFVVLLADDLISTSGKNCIQQMIEVYEKTQSSVVAVEKVDRENLEKYGVVGFQGEISPDVKIDQIVEKPTPEHAPSSFGVAGRYLFESAIFDALSKIPLGSGGEFQLTDAIQRLISEREVYALSFEGQRYDCGDKLGYLKAVVDTALSHPGLAEGFAAWLNSKTLEEV